MTAFSSDTLRGAGALAKYIFGPKGKRRSIYSMNEERRKRYGLWLDGHVICGRRSVIDQVGKQPEQDPEVRQ